jgi:regulator of sigma E protease
MTVPESGQLGVYNTGEVFKYYEIKNKAYTFAEALGGAGGEVQNKLMSYIRQFKLIFNPKTEAV